MQNFPQQLLTASSRLLYFFDYFWVADLTFPLVLLLNCFYLNVTFAKYMVKDLPKLFFNVRCYLQCDSTAEISLIQCKRKDLRIFFCSSYFRLYFWVQGEKKKAMNYLNTGLNFDETFSLWTWYKVVLKVIWCWWSKLCLERKCLMCHVWVLCAFYHPWLIQTGAASYVKISDIFVSSSKPYLRFLAKLLGKVNLFPSVSLASVV